MHSEITEVTEIAPQPPIAARIPTPRSHHGDTFIDDFQWLSDPENPEVLAHLQAEQAYAEALTADQEPLRQAIFTEIKNRTLETDLSVPHRRGDWWYYRRTAAGQQYPIHCRISAESSTEPSSLVSWTPPVIDAERPDPTEQILIDGNAEAEGNPFFSLGDLTVSRDQNLLAYSADHRGDERFSLRIKDLRSGVLLPDRIDNVFYGAAFSPDGTELFYTVADDSWRPHQVWAHRLGSSTEQDELIFQEDSPGMWLSLDLAADRRSLLLTISCSEYSEVRILDFQDREAGLRTVISREERILYEAEPVLTSAGRALLLTHNRHARNSMVSLLPWTDLGRPLADQHWDTVLPHDEAVRVYGVQVTASHAIVSLRRNTTETVLLFDLSDLCAPPTTPEFDEALSTVNLAGAEYQAPVIRLQYTSFLIPPRVYDYVLETGELLLRKETPVLGGYQPADYIAEREWAAANDGTLVPLSVIRRADLEPNGQNPAVIYGYGSYEASMDPGFSIPRLSLLDRGIVFVIAHVRGGGELGRAWYEDGKKLAKKNSFTDFLATADWLAESSWADPARIAAMGGSAGGLLMGAVLNLAPARFTAVLAQVPFVDALTTILNPELPLSALEWEEWGNPLEDPEVYRYMKSYSPYENVRATDYPKIAAVTSLNDARVLPAEPAKWVQELRRTGTGEQPIILKVEMEAGHGGASGRYAGWQARAWDYAFLIDALEAPRTIS